ncbi:hypothetical protein EDEG_00905 [Edhazardia aedis USNM 41457]|uniref:Uncharacterized protein n=1 Tax=Edhazardia aedis (strain USNM 41457) TaxID=1003232 RepID=J8ZZ81_EDHAE|nr:hypothetical protein EDEG_00905 [Edhazardia aedis USNM 41457]|eukprot:EJW04988.1 hypothetical protein EDEG_00905 [Edhazardia aedis USNM 41457]
MKMNLQNILNFVFISLFAWIFTDTLFVRKVQGEDIRQSNNNNNEKLHLWMEKKNFSNNETTGMNASTENFDTRANKSKNIFTDINNSSFSESDGISLFFEVNSNPVNSYVKKFDDRTIKMKHVAKLDENLYNETDDAFNTHEDKIILSNDIGNTEFKENNSNTTQKIYQNYNKTVVEIDQPDNDYAQKNNINDEKASDYFRNREDVKKSINLKLKHTTSKLKRKNEQITKKNLKQYLDKQKLEIFANLTDHNIVLKKLNENLKSKCGGNGCEVDVYQAITVISKIENGLERFMAFGSFIMSLNKSSFFPSHLNTKTGNNYLAVDLNQKIKNLNYFIERVIRAILVQSKDIENSNIYKPDDYIENQCELEVKNYIEKQNPFDLVLHSTNFCNNFSNYIKNFCISNMLENQDSSKKIHEKKQFELNEFKNRVYITKHNLLLKISCLDIHPNGNFYCKNRLNFLSNQLHKYFSNTKLKLNTKKWYYYDRELFKVILRREGKKVYSRIFSETMKHLITFDKELTLFKQDEKFSQRLKKLYNQERLWVSDTSEIKSNAVKINILIIYNHMLSNESKNIFNGHANFNVIVGSG